MRPFAFNARPVATATALLALAACGDDAPLYYPTDARSDVTTSDVTGDAVSDSSITDTSGTDAEVMDVPPTDTGGEDTAAPDVPTAQGIVGGVTVLEIRADDAPDLESGGIGAAFTTTTPTPTAPIATVGACEIREAGDAFALLQSGPSLDAGTITVTLDGEAVTLTHDGTGYVSSASEDRIEFFEEGAAISFSAPGGDDVPAFSGTLLAPAAPVVTEPSWSFGDSHDRDTPLPVAWSGAAGTAAIINVLPVEIFPEPGIADGNAITCSVADTGTFTIPAEALGYLPAASGMGGGTVALTVVRLSNIDAAAGADTITLNATATETVIGGVE